MVRNNIKITNCSITRLQTKQPIVTIPFHLMYTVRATVSGFDQT